MNTHSITYIKMPESPDGCWKVKGSTWSTLAGPWLIAHDLFHHAPGDTGSVAEELATIGAELYINHEHEAMAVLQQADWQVNALFSKALVSLANSADAIVGIPFDEGIASPDMYMLPEAVIEERLPAALEHLLDRCSRCAVDSLADLVVSDESWEDTRACFSVDRVIDQMRRGYLQAQKRFPDQRAAQAAFIAAKRAIAGHNDDPDGSEITVSRIGLTVTIQ